MLDKQPTEISFKELEEFCEQKIPESAILDYKKESTTMMAPIDQARIGKS